MHSRRKTICSFGNSRPTRPRRFSPLGEPARIVSGLQEPPGERCSKLRKKRPHGGAPEPVAALSPVDRLTHELALSAAVPDTTMALSRAICNAPTGVALGSREKRNVVRATRAPRERRARDSCASVGIGQAERRPSSISLGRTEAGGGTTGGGAVQTLEAALKTNETLRETQT